MNYNNYGAAVNAIVLFCTGAVPHSKIAQLQSLWVHLRGLSFSFEWGAMRKLGGHKFFMRNMGSQKIKRLLGGYKF